MASQYEHYQYVVDCSDRVFQQKLMNIRLEDDNV